MPLESTQSTPMNEIEQQRGDWNSPMPRPGRELGEMARILVHALVGIDADLTGIPEHHQPPRRQPLLDQVARQFARLQLDHLVRPVRAR